MRTDIIFLPTYGYAIFIAMATKKKARDPDPAASALAAKRWKKTTEEERSQIARDMNASRWADKSPEERLAHGAKLAAARAKKAKKKGAGK